MKFVMIAVILVLCVTNYFTYETAKELWDKANNRLTFPSGLAMNDKGLSTKEEVYSFIGSNVELKSSLGKLNLMVHQACPSLAEKAWVVHISEGEEVDKSYWYVRATTSYPGFSYSCSVTLNVSGEPLSKIVCSVKPTKFEHDCRKKVDNIKEF